MGIVYKAEDVNLDELSAEAQELLVRKQSWHDLVNRFLAEECARRK